MEVMNWFFCPHFVYQRKVKGGLMDSFCGNSCCARLLKHLCENTAANYLPPRRRERLLDKQEAEYKYEKLLFFFYTVFFYFHQQQKIIKINTIPMNICPETVALLRHVGVMVTC